MTARPDQDGDHELTLLGAAWDKAVRHWHDDAASQFTTNHWTPLIDESRSYLEALRTLIDLLDNAERDTDY
jgi:hypothetical protein